MTLNNNDYKEISSMLEIGNGYVEFEKDEEILTFDYTYEVEGEFDYENNYFNETSIYLLIDNVECINEDGDDVKVELDEKKLYKMVA